MKRLTLVLAAALALAIPLGANLGAQDAPARLAFVDSQSLIAAHPAGRAANELRELAAEEIGDIRARLDALQAKARSEGLDNDEAELFNILLATLESVQTRYSADINAAAQPAIVAVNDAIRAVAEANGVAVVFDIDAAASSGLVVFAADGLDLTEQVAARLQ
jgi:outer membrane protein